MLPITASATSFAVTPRPSGPSTVTRRFFIFFTLRHCVASTCSTSEVPMPNARQPNAPCVLVCESPHTTVIPGSVAPVSGPITCTMPWRLSRNGK